MLTKEEAKKQRDEIQKTLQDGRKAHYAALGGAGYYVWIDSKKPTEGDQE